MRHTARETQHHTLTRLITAMDRHHPVTLTYLKEEKDDHGRRTGRLVETVRTIEIYDVTISQAGDILLKAIDRQTGESRSWRLDRIQTYTVHRTAYVVERPAADVETARAPRPASLATVTALPLPAGTDAVDALADQLAA